MFARLMENTAASKDELDGDTFNRLTCKLIVLFDMFSVLMII